MTRAAPVSGDRRSPLFLKWRPHRAFWIGAAVVVGVAGAGGLWIAWSSRRSIDPADSAAAEVVAHPTAVAGPGDAKPDPSVSLDAAQQKAIGLRTITVASGAVNDVLTAPGRIAPNETQYAFITPRAAGVVRAVMAHVGQDVKAGDLLATIDSPEVGEARLELYTRLQALELARAQANWQAKVYESTLELVKRLRSGETPEQIHEALADRPVGDNREKLMTAYAQYRLADATMTRNRELFAQKLITPKQFEKVRADYEVAQASYQSLMDQTGYENRLAHTRAQQLLKQAETAVRAAQEHLRILGVKPDGTEPKVERGRVVGVDPDGTLSGQQPGEPRAPGPEKILPKEGTAPAVDPVGAHHEAKPSAGDAPVSTYSIWAPFDGTILDREMIVPGVAVDTTHRIFTMVNLSTVWVEVSVHESEFDMLSRSRGAQVRFRSPAYPERLFEGRVIYTGDLVEEKSRTVKLLAEAPNPDRLLKPGMFVEVQVVSPRDAPAISVPASALLIQGTRTFVYVRTDPVRFTRREVVSSSLGDEQALILSGLHPGEEVVIEGGTKLKALATQHERAGS